MSSEMEGLYMCKDIVAIIRGQNCGSLVTIGDPKNLLIISIYKTNRSVFLMAAHCASFEV
jgi:hypothetical protein